MSGFGLACGLIMGLQFTAFGQSHGDKTNAAKKADDPKQQEIYESYFWTMEPSGQAHARLLNWSRYLGADLAVVDPPLRSQLKLNDGEGYVVVNVKPDGAGAESGLQLYDVVLGLQDEPKPEVAYPVQVWRAGVKKPVTVKAKPDHQWWIGVNLAEIDDAMRSQLSVAAGRGLLVQDVTDDSPAKQAGIQKFDVIVGLGDGTASGSVEEFSRVIQKSDGKTLTVQILRHGKSLSVNVTPQNRTAEAASGTWVAEAALFSRLQPTWIASPTEQHSNYIRLLSAVQRRALASTARANDRESKLAAVEMQLDQLLKEVQSARQTIEELRKLEEPKKQKASDEKK
jgi:serine protease Do